MKWPFVLASTHDAAVAGRDALIVVLRADIERVQGWAGEWRSRHDALADKYHALKLRGAAVPEPKPMLTVTKPSGPIADAINDVCEKFGNSVKLRRRLMKYAEDCKREAPDMDERDIAHAITHWRDPDAEEAS